MRGQQRAMPGRVSALRVIERVMIELQHRVNPLHIYCRLVDHRLSNRTSLRVCRRYEQLVYPWVLMVTTLSIAACRAWR